MKIRNWLLLTLLSIVGYGATFYFSPKVLPVARWGLSLDRSQAVTKAKDLAASLGIEQGDWIPLVETTYDRKNEYYEVTQPTGLGAGVISAIKTQVTLLDPQTYRKVKVAFRPNGSPQEFLDRMAKNNTSGNKPSDVGEKSSLMTEEDKVKAGTAFKSFWGKKLFDAASLVESSRTDQDTRYIWKAEDSYLKLTAKVVMREGKVKELSLDREFTKLFEGEFKSRRSTAAEVISSADVIVIIPAVLLVMIFYFLGLALKRVQHRQGFVFLSAMFVLVLLIVVMGRMADDLRDGNVTGNAGRWLVILIPWLLVLLVTLCIAGSIYFFWAAGQSLTIRLPYRRTVSLELLLQGKVFTKPIARSIAVGLLAGGIIISIPILIAASQIFPGLELDAHGLENDFASRSPAFTSFFAPRQYLLFIAFGFIAPLVCVYVKRPLVARSIIFVCVVLCLIGSSFIYISAGGMIVTSLLMAIVLVTLYFQADLVATMVSLFGSHAAIDAASLLAQPSASLHRSGWNVLACLFGFLLVSLVGLWKFREVSEEETAIPAYLLETRIERERLKADFNIARRAQQQMLPDSPPQIPGLEIAAVCRPSKEVGGDLYDFLPLRDGKLGIAVADVSGKGVPASLYMTLTKGLLTSIAETVDDPAEILREVNRHLYEVCRRKMFVTLFLGVVDPSTKQFVYARAGHNPTVFRSVARQETILLKPKGMGLGLNNGKIFDQSLKVGSLQLAPSDKLFFYSDGITEAMNYKNEEYGEERLMEVARATDNLAAGEARDAVMADVTQFLGLNQPQDDQTLVVLKVV